ncbi:uncharacterized protein LOC116211163 [Punica granatum]|uniref:Uncharacterized protein LOC116211163 n=1 Tax=Punica granatum TaxID=22663 RepID=A0A6P8E0N3_PUNGR|nr:uncharacterized protein LOC116211163 [Punica granatum]
MEIVAQKTQRTCQDRKGTRIGQQCGRSRLLGIEGLVVWGGTLAIAGLMAVFTIGTAATRRKRGSGSTIRDESASIASNEAEENNDEMKKGLGVVLVCDGKCWSLPADARRDQCCCIHRGGSKTGAAYVDSCESISSQTLSLVNKEEKPAPIWHGEEESQIQQQEMILLSDDSQPESIASCNEFCFAEEFHLLGGGKRGTESSPVNSDDEEDSEEEEEEEEDGTMEEYVTEEGEESSDEDRDSSSESNFETVWPVGSIDKASPRFGSLSNTDNRNANMIGECYSTGGDRKILGKGVLLEEAIWQRHQMAHLPKSGTWVLFVGIALLLLLPLLLSILPDSTMNTFNATCTDAFTVP